MSQLRCGAFGRIGRRADAGEAGSGGRRRFAGASGVPRPLIPVTGEVTGSGLEYELLVGFTRLALLDPGRKCPR
ncbi:MAG: hypothetical protein MUP31_04915 [Xanthomonadales bacterium]|nr:hypothetical protein [Xanthomonadales bacterium]